MLASSPQKLAVGVHDTTLGWVEVRAQTAAGQVSATLTTSSPTAHAALTAELPAMRAALAGQPVQVNTALSQGAPAGSSPGGGQGSPSQHGGEHATPQREMRAPEVGDAETENARGSFSWIDVRV